jgi:hypothetical protein
MTDVTLGNYLSALKRAVKSHTNYQYNRLQNQDLAAVSIASHNITAVLTRVVYPDGSASN